ncbi:MAG TPA: DNA-binding protein [Candidatus Avoscillospira stercoripullorum]|uniref:N(6)-L-threonylcarbamoyladenine synthase n=1 Tax=Candidatus Avoscillospira stercoripullorum TaxID=2840709 RepID=A0A9D1A8X4_9FIRM|nr:DNA-binding protein [Candidatus Avoscillospira stercoripullorum]
MYLGIDTSNYTTSVAAFDGRDGVNRSRLLDVAPGQLGLRQSDALFSHVKRLPVLMEQLFSAVSPGEIQAVAVSTRPRAVEGSYMPCFLAGVAVAKSLAAALGVPCHEVSHQQGHVAAALWSAGRMDLMDKPHLAWHLSGGTTELLSITPEGKNVRAEKIGGTSDISAGQIMDRTGKLLALPFPAGKALDQLSQGVEVKPFRVKTQGLTFSLSGLENQVVAFYQRTNSPEETAAFAVSSVCDVVLRTTREAQKQYPGLEVVFSGGVASNLTLRRVCGFGVFAAPQFSTDNAMGVAVLAERLSQG